LVLNADFAFLATIPSTTEETSPVDRKICRFRRLEWRAIAQ
jgi:hypothetical protein